MGPIFLPLLLGIASALADMSTVSVVKPAAPIAVPLGDIAQRAAHIAVRVAGVSESDSEIDHMQTRARASALLPEFRFRVMDSSAGIHDYISDTGTLATSYFGPSIVVEGSVTFHFDRLAYSGQEARLERLRLERIEARARITQRVIDEISRWSKATAEERDTPDGTEAHAEATARRVSAQMALDVWTAGWFSEVVKR